MAKDRKEAWEEMIRNARKAGFIIRHDHDGVAVIERGGEAEAEPGSEPGGEVGAKPRAT